MSGAKGARTTAGAARGLRPAATLLFALMLGTLAAACTDGSSDRATVSGTQRWRPLAAADLSRTEVSAARVGGAIFVVGGFVSPDQTTAAVERYDIRRDRWTRVSPLPVAVNHAAAAAHHGRLYVYGGYTDSSFGPVTAALQSYNPGTDSWSLLPQSPTPRAAAGLAAIHGRLYAVGGAAGGRVLTTLESFDVADRSWTTEPSMKVPREHIAAAGAAGELYVFGGRDGGANLRVVERYDPGRHDWDRLPPMRTARSGIAAAVVRGRPVVFGGEELVPGGHTIRSVELFEPDQHRWRRLPGMRTPRHGLGGAARGRRVYSLEGGPQPAFAFSDRIEFLDVSRRLLR